MNQQKILIKVNEGINIINSINQDPKKYVAFFDIDSTLVDINGLLIEPVFFLYKKTIEKGITVVIITARPGFTQNLEWTKEQLYNLGIRNYSLLVAKPPQIEDIYQYKLFARRMVVEKGYIPLFTIGDMDFDMGKYGGTELLIS
jgi:hypothetical protein